MEERTTDDTHATDIVKKQNNMDINSEENVIKYHFVPSLQHVSLITIITTIWNKTELKIERVELETECINYPIHNYISQLGQKVVEKISQLALPDRIKKLLSNIVHPIGKEIFKWVLYQDRQIFFSNVYDCQQSIAVNYIDALVWTSKGMIDYKETAKHLLAKKGALPDFYKYNIACEYCLEDDVEIIAPKIRNFFILKPFEEHPMLYFWTAHLTGDYSELEKGVHSFNDKFETDFNTNECIFVVLVRNKGRNQIAIKYVWEKLSKEEKLRLIVPTLGHWLGNVDITCFFLSQLNKDQEKEVFGIPDTDFILRRFLNHWLWGQYFLPVIYKYIHILHRECYLSVIDEIIWQMEGHLKDIEKVNHYKAIFKKLWHYAPAHLKDYVIERWDGEYLNRNFEKESVGLLRDILEV